VPSPHTNRQNGRKSRGPKTANGRRTSALAKTKHGIFAFSPVLPGESKQSWIKRHEGYRQYFQPQGAVEEDFVYELALAVHQRRRIHKHEDAVTREGMKVDIFSEEDKQGVEPEITTILEGNEQSLLNEIASFERLVELLQNLKREPDQTPLESTQAEGLVDWLFNANRSQDDVDETEQDGSPIADPPPEGWTFGSIRQVMTELSEALSKSPEAVLSDTIERGMERLGDRHQRLETAWLYVRKNSVPEAAPLALLDLYDRRSLNKISKLLNLLERVQSVRMGRPVVPVIPIDHTLTFNDNGD